MNIVVPVKLVPDLVEELEIDESGTPPGYGLAAPDHQRIRRSRHRASHPAEGSWGGAVTVDRPQM